MTYMGHSEAIRDVYFTNDGLHFLSASYDKRIHYWDTETGKVVKTFDLKKFPYCVRFHPDDEKQYAFLCASSNKKVLNKQFFIIYCRLDNMMSEQEIELNSTMST